MDRPAIFFNIETELLSQEQQWGHIVDDRHTAADWQTFINEQFYRGFNSRGDLQGNPRKALVNAAAVAVAAIEAYDRNGGLPLQNYLVTQDDVG
jgi:hypothetical protein